MITSIERRKRITLGKRFQVGAVLALVLGMLAMPAFASAQSQSPSDDQYSVVPPSTSTGTGGDPGDPSGLSGRVGPLPFTGFDVIAMTAVALAIAGLGLGLQRAVASRPQE
jgi:hypothetical protein